LLLVPLDMVLMTQVLVNLLDNAHKHAPAGSGIEIRGYLDSDWLVLEVADCGPGVPEAELSRLFDKFYHISIPEKAGGIGLGLSICKGIVEAHGGTIGARNRAGGGLCMEIRLPRTVGTENHDVS
jgi:two-component system sensor histidine kinase KdpD